MPTSPYTNGIMPTFGVTVPPGDALNTTDALIKNGIEPTFFADGCRFYVEAASVNGLISEILNAVNCSGLEYDPDRLDNLCLAIQKIATDAQGEGIDIVGKICADPDAIAALVQCVLSDQAGNQIVVGSDGGLFVAAIDDPDAPPIDVWSIRCGIGQVYFVDTSLAGVEIPPSAIPGVGPVFIQLTSGLSGGSNYNAGKLSTEAVSGAIPRRIAYATVSLASSPMAGQIVRLLNTEGRFQRPSINPGSLQDDALQGHSHAVVAGAGGSGTGLDFPIVSDGTEAWAFLQVPGGGSGEAGGHKQKTVGSGTPEVNEPVDLAGYGTVQVQQETRVRNVGVTAYMRIR